MYKRCLKCQERLPYSDFSKQPGKLGGLAEKCKPCSRLLKSILSPQKLAVTRARVRDWKNKNLDKIRKLSRALTARFGVGRYSAKRRKLVWLMSMEEFAQILSNPCFYCGASLANGAGSGLDRIDNKLGYYPENVVACCGDCNRIRGNYLTCGEMKAAMKAVLDYRSQQKAA